MLACLGKRAQAVLGGGLLALLLAAPTAALTQAPERGVAGRPMPLLPGTPDQPAAPPPPDSGAPAATAPAAPPPAGDGIEVKQLPAFDPSSAGVLDKAQGGFGVDLWSGTSMALVRSLLPRLPVATSSAAMQSLARRLLLSAARVPEGEPQRPSLLALRMERLAETGQLKDVNALLQVTPASLGDAEIAEARLDTALLGGDDAAACSVAERMVETDDAPQWQTAMAYCMALRDDTLRAELYEQLLREGGYQEKTFFALFDAMLGRGALKLQSLASPTPLQLAMLRQLGVAVPGDAVNGASPMVLAALANAPNASPELRLEAAERAEAIGALPTPSLRQVYDSMSIAPQELADAVERARKAPGPRTNALLYQVARAAAAPNDRAAAIQVALENGRRLERYGMAARVHAPLVQELAPEPDLAWFAADAGRALLAADQPEAAFQWFFMAQSIADEAQPEAATAVLDLWPLMQVADVKQQLPYRPDITRLWWQGQVAVGRKDRFDRAIVLATLLEALGYEVPADVWATFHAASTYSTETVPSPMLRQGLDRASEAGRLGETVLFALHNLGPQGPGAAPPTTLSEVVRALSRVGLAADARRIALEALLARGF